MPEIDSLSPNTGRPFAQWREIAEGEVSARIERVAAAALSDIAARREALERISAALAAGREELAALTVAEVGKTPAEAEAEIDYAESFLETSRRLLDTYPFETALGDGRRVRETPRGASLLIAPFNDPVAGLTRKIGPSLAAGAGAVVKPSELGVQVALALARHMSAAGLDDAVCVLPIAERARIAALVGRAEIGAVSFTGSTVAGRSVAVEAARRGKAFVGELGGTNPFVILEDADIARAVGDLVARKLKAAGQACSAPNIVLVERAAADETVERIASAFDAAAAGPSDTPGYALGPVRSAAALSRLAEHATALERAGARRLGRGVAPPAPEAAYLADPTAYVVDEPGLFFETEMFGPLLGVCVVDGRDALRALLAANRHPLALYVYGADEAGASALVDGLRYGSIGFNTTAIQSPDAPTGGFDGAGVGREGGPWGLREFLTTINMRHGEA